MNAKTRDTVTPNFFDTIHSQKIVQALEDFYAPVTLRGVTTPLLQFMNECSELYDLLLPDHERLKTIPADDKKNYWNIAKENVKKYHKHWFDSQHMKNKLPGLAEKYYKTELLKHYLIEMYKEGYTLQIMDQNDNVLTPFSFIK